MLAWDVIVLNGYLVLNLAIPFYILYSHYTGREPAKKKYVPVDLHLGHVGGEHPPGHGVPARGPAGPAVLELRAARAPLPGLGLHRRAGVHDPAPRVHPARHSKYPIPDGAIHEAGH